MKRFIILAAGLLAALPCFAGAGDTTGSSGTYNIADYHPPRFRTQSLYLFPGLYFGADSRDDSSSQNRDKRRNNWANEGVSFGGSHYIHRYAVMSDIEISTSGSIHGSGYAQDADVTKDKYYHSENSPGASYSLTNSTRYRRYLPFGIFIEGQVYPSISHDPASSSKYQDYAIYDRGYDSTGNRISLYHVWNSAPRSNRFTFNSGISACIGKGWVVDVTGAAIALQMIDRINALTGTRLALSREQTDALASLLDRSRWKRIFDSRISTIESIDTLCQYMVREHILAKETARMTMELHDIWAYGFAQTRYTGYELNLAPVGEVYFNQNVDQGTSKELDTVVPYDPAVQSQDLGDYPVHRVSRINNYNSKMFLMYGSKVSGKCSRLISRDLEFDGALQLAATMNTLGDSMSVDTLYNGYYSETYPNARINLTAGLKWYPTIRSDISFYNQFSYSRDFNITSSVFNDRGYVTDINRSQGVLNYLEFSSTLYTSYYISPRCSFSLSATARYNQGQNRWGNYYYYWYWPQNTYRSWNASFYSTVTYAVF